MTCQFCGNSFSAGSSIKNHVVRCASNPGRIVQNGRLGKQPWNKNLTKETSDIVKKISEKVSIYKRVFLE